MTNTVACKGRKKDVFEKGSTDPVAASQLETELTRALDNQEFRVYYQPIVSLETSEIRGFEALVRWRHPSRGLLSPSDFLPVMENTGLIVPLGLWVLREASSKMHEWHRRFPNGPLLYLSVNISSKLFQEPDLVEQISRILNETGLNPASLILEITETVVMQNAETTRSILLRLRALNIRLAIDDFGTGYSSLSYLQNFPVHTLKIDHSFVSRLQEDKESVEIVRAVVTLAHNLGLDVIAEGIEAGHQGALLRLLRCESGQGHFYSQAVDDQRAGKLIDKRTFLPVTAGDTMHAVTSRHDCRDDALLKDLMSSPADRSREAGTGSETDQKLRDAEFEIHVENLKKDAIKQFDQGLYTVCLPSFQLLCELEPANRLFRDYVDLSRRLARQTLIGDSGDPSQVESGTSVVRTETSVPRSLSSHGNLGHPQQGNSQPASERPRSISTEAEVDTKVEEGHSWPGEKKNRRLAFLGAIAATVFIMLVLGIRTQGNGQRPTASAESQDVVTARVALDEARPGPVQGSGVARTTEVEKEDISSAELNNSRSDGKHDSSNQPRSHEKNLSKAHQSSVAPEGLPESQAATAVTRDPRQQLTADYRSYPVIHDHLLGSCSGYLRITPELIVFEPTQVKGHAFALKLTDIVGTERGETLKIKFAHETYRFKAKFAKDKIDNLSRLASLDQRLTKFRSEAGLHRR